MAGAQLVANLEYFKLRSINTAWVNMVWELDFTETEPLDSRMESEITENGPEVFSQLYESLFKFIDQPQQADVLVDVWTFFKENNLSHNALIAVLHHFVHMVQNKRANVIQREYALHAAGLYFLLLEIPGSVANRTFHPVLFDKCLDAIKKSWPATEEGNRKRKKDTQMKNPQTAAKGRKRAKPVRQQEILEEDEDEGDVDVFFSTHDLCRVRDDIFSLLKRVLRLLSKFSLKEKPDCAQHCLWLFTELINFEPVIGVLDFTDSVDIDGMKTLPELAYYGLKLLCSPNHGDVNKTLRWLFQRLLSTIILVGGEEGSKSCVLLGVGQKVITARDQAIKFISYIVDQVEETALPVLRVLLQHICIKVPDKVEYRTHGAQAVVKLLTKLPSVEFVAFLHWLNKYSQNSKVAYRNFALDVVMALMELPEREEDGSVPPEHQKYLCHKYWIQFVILGRCSDKAPSVRSRALCCLAQCLELNASNAVAYVQEILLGIGRQSGFHGRSDVESTSLENSVKMESEAPNIQHKTPRALKSIEVADSGNSTLCNATTNQCKDTLKSVEVTDPGNSTFTNVKEIMTMLRLRAGDERTIVRKSAIQLFVSILKHNLVVCTQEDLSTLQDHCRDPAPSVRKQTLQSITDLLLAQPSNTVLQKAWMSGVIPVVVDSESAVQEKALECLNRVIIQQIKDYKHFSEEDKYQRLTWDILEFLALENQELCRYLTKAFLLWSHQNLFNSTFIKCLISHAEAEHAPAAWMLLSKIAGLSPKLNYGKIIDSWENVYRSQNIDNSTSHVLNVIGNIAEHLSEATRSKLIDEVQNWINAFCSPPEIISSAVETLYKLCQAQCETPKDTQVLLDQVCGKLILACESYISSVVLEDGGVENADENMMIKHLFTLGEVAQLCPRKVEKRIFMLVQSFLATPLNLDPDGDDVPASQPLSQFSGSPIMPSVIRAHAFFTLGKLCLQHEDLAKKCIAALARELEVCENVAVRNNVIIIMCDLCMRYTSMVDRYIPNIAVCLKDDDPFIRKQTLVMLTNLLQEEFIKWKGSLFFRFVSVLVDPDESIRRFAEFCLVYLLLKRNPVMFSQHFIECILHFNGYEKHEKYNKFPQTEREKKLFSLRGNKNLEKRMTIYKFLLEHFTDEQRFSITNKIAQNILACFVDGVLPLDMEANELLSDTFVVMSCKEIKLSSMKTKPGDEAQMDDEMAMANAVMQAAQKKLISQVQKKNFVENIIPIVTSLKNQLEQKHLPALKDLMHYLREVMQDYRNEVKDFFAVDKQLAAELEYDLKKYEEQLVREEEEKQNPQTALEMANPTSTTALSPRVSPPAVSDAQAGSEAQSPLGLKAAQPTTSLQKTPTLASCGFITPKTGMLKMPKFTKPRSMSLSSVAILNSARKAAEFGKKKRNNSSGSMPLSSSGKNDTVQRLAAGRDGAEVSFQGEGEHTRSEASSADSSVVERAVSTPDKTIDNVTFAAGVSYISITQTPTSEKSKEHAQEEQKSMLCLMSPDKPVPHPRQWNVESPATRKTNETHGRTRSQKKYPLRPSN
ncbi:condensin-2 complex subunit D3 isoform X2 [Stegostoma tigrinum]|uniref:condensin-2 complex subunit D3 isoform X2 n=1 Tax=Stegostoma tigrinum TaxID=3053191 RepID=UPI00202B42E2|nr:condensin-2 complex subunit D3 isoform X2 [Stegostoma tigrinum]